MKSTSLPEFDPAAEITRGELATELGCTIEAVSYQLHRHRIKPLGLRSLNSYRVLAFPRAQALEWLAKRQARLTPTQVAAALGLSRRRATETIRRNDTPLREIPPAEVPVRPRYWLAPDTYQHDAEHLPEKVCLAELARLLIAV